MIKRQSYALKAGNLNNLKLVEENLPDPIAGQVTVAVSAIGLNFADIFAMFGLYSATPKGTFIPGLEYAGTIVKTGPGVTSVKIGDRVMGVTRFGAYTTHLNIEETYVIPIPNGWTDEEASGYLVQVLTAYYGLTYLGRLEKGETVLIHSAAGGVGILANRIAKKYGAFTIGSVGNSAKVDFCKKEGYDQVIVRSNSFGNDLKKALGERKLNVVMECIGGKIFTEGFKQMTEQGRMVIYGAAQYASPGKRPNYLKAAWMFLNRPKIDAQGLAEDNKTVSGFNLIYLYEKAELLHQLLGELKDLNLEKPHVGNVIDFDKMIEAIQLFQTGKTMGKVVVKVNNPSI